MKQGEIDYLKNLGDDGLRHAFDKPFSDGGAGKNLADLGIIMTLLPAPPGRLLDLGCGTGWTTWMFGRRGWRVTGQDIAPDMIEWARRNAQRNDIDAEFIIADYESLPYDSEFDAAVFYDSLHHADDEAAAIRSAYRALKPGGVLVTHEPGIRHSKLPESIAAMEKYGVNEKDMPPSHIMKLGRSVGFRSARRLPNPGLLLRSFYGIDPVIGTATIPTRRRLYFTLALLHAILLPKIGGICVLRK